MSICFHCNEPLSGSTLVVHVAGRDEPVCCHGCLAVASLIADAGLSDFYRFRTAAAARPDTDGPLDAAEQAHDSWSAYERPEVAAQFVQRHGDTDSATLLVDGLRCAACGWLIERMIAKARGMHEVSMNAATARVHLRWDRSLLSLGQIMREIARLGYRPCPLDDTSQMLSNQRESRSALRRLAVAGLGMMQVMMFAVAVYAAELNHEVMEAGILQYFRLVSLLVATPVMFYAGAPILRSGWNSVRLRTIGMDVPVSLALLLAYAASIRNALLSGGEVYFDSVTMFIFFVSLGRFVQMSVRHRTTDLTGALARQLPAVAHRLTAGEVRDVPTAALRRDDEILVRSGEIVPADGMLLSPEGLLDESMLTGESTPVRRFAGDRIAAGTLNAHSPIRIRATAIAGDTLLSHIVSLLHKAQALKPALARAADAAAGRFLGYVMVSAALTCGAWLVFDPSRAFAATLAVLVVACPCAFAIATPAAVSAAMANLARRGVLVMNPNAIEPLARIDRFVFDKTGTLTRGHVAIRRCTTLGNLDEEQCRRIAASLEAGSEHPLARAFARKTPTTVAQALKTASGAGVEGVVAGRRYRIGTPKFVGRLRCANDSSDAATVEPASSSIVLGDEECELARFELHDDLRGSAAPAMQALRALRITPEILSGDSETAVADAASHCGDLEYTFRATPAAKLAHVQKLRNERRCVAMMGDGINDAPVLAAADVSVAMARGAALAQVGADMILVGDNLLAVVAAIEVAKRTLRIAHQNRIWSAAYNLACVPLAAFGFIPPWLAALGMSLSSAAVVLNAMRLLPVGRTPSRHRDTNAMPVALKAAA